MKNESLLINSGIGISNILNEIRKLTQNPVTVVATHTHWDHIGGHKLFNSFYVHNDDEDWISGKFPLTLDYIKTLVVKEPCQIPQQLIKSRKKIRPQAQADLFTNLLFCADFGHAMHFKNNRKGYICGNHDKHVKTACSDHIVREK